MTTQLEQTVVAKQALLALFALSTARKMTVYIPVKQKQEEKTK